MKYHRKWRDMVHHCLNSDSVKSWMTIEQLEYIAARAHIERVRAIETAKSFWSHNIQWN
jgi:hypothetical protein